MKLKTIYAAGLVLGSVLSSSAHAAETRANIVSAAPATAVQAHGLRRSSSGQRNMAKAADATGVIAGVAAVGAIGFGVYELVKSDSSGS